MSNLLPTIKHTGNIPADFTGVVYNDVGKFNFAAVVNGQFLKRKDNKVRWFHYEMEAARAAYAEAQKQKQAIEDQLDNFNWVGSRHHY